MMKSEPKVTHRRQRQMEERSKGEIHTRPAIAAQGPRIKGIHVSQDDKIKLAIRNLRMKDQQEHDTFEEADDFDVGEEEPDMFSPFEMTDMQQDYEFQPETEKTPEQEKKEEGTKESAPKEALEKGADTKEPPSKENQFILISESVDPE